MPQHSSREPAKRCSRAQAVDQGFFRQSAAAEGKSAAFFIRKEKQHEASLLYLESPFRLLDRRICGKLPLSVLGLCPTARFLCRQFRPVVWAASGKRGADGGCRSGDPARPVPSETENKSFLKRTNRKASSDARRLGGRFLNRGRNAPKVSPAFQRRRNRSPAPSAGWRCRPASRRDTPAHSRRGLPE